MTASSEATWPTERLPDAINTGAGIISQRRLQPLLDLPAPKTSAQIAAFVHSCRNTCIGGGVSPLELPEAREKSMNSRSSRAFGRRERAGPEVGVIHVLAILRV